MISNLFKASLIWLKMCVKLDSVYNKCEEKSVC